MFLYTRLKKKIAAFVCFAFGIAFCLIFFSCGNAIEPGKKEQVDPRKYKQILEKINKYEVTKETDEINQYIARHGWAMEKTGTGLRYLIVEKGTGVQAKPGDIAVVSYKISLLDGTVCYSSEKDGNKDFKVEGDNIESGLHEAVMLMHAGGKAKFILPSYMANGLLGDNDRIPPMSAILVDLELLEVK